MAYGAGPMSTLLPAFTALALAGAPEPAGLEALKAKVARVKLEQQSQALDALVARLAPRLDATRVALDDAQTAQFLAAWNGVMAATDEAVGSLSANKTSAGGVTWWRSQLLRSAGADERLHRLTASEGSRPLATALAYNLVLTRQRRAELEALRTLGEIWYGTVGPGAAKKPGLWPPACPDGTHAPKPDDEWASGCRFVYRIETHEADAQRATAHAVARGVVDPVQGVELRLALGAYAYPVERTGGRRPLLVPLPGAEPNGLAEDEAEPYPAMRGLSQLSFDPTPEPAQTKEEEKAFQAALTPPVRIGGMDPGYTHRAFLVKAEGLVVAKCIIEKDGWVYDCRLEKTLPYMSQAVLDALATRRYQPVTYQGKVIACDYVFNIKLMMPGH